MTLRHKSVVTHVSSPDWNHGYLTLFLHSSCELSQCPKHDDSTINTCIILVIFIIIVTTVALLREHVIIIVIQFAIQQVPFDSLRPPCRLVGIGAHSVNFRGTTFLPEKNMHEKLK